MGAHRMAITVRGNETVLGDPIVYAGEPEDFVWVLPVAAGIEVELAENAFFEALAVEARLRLDGPLVCLPPGAGDVASVTAPVGYETGPIARPMDFPLDASERDVAISHEGVVGPYETLTLRGDVGQLVSWLVERGYLVPESFVPILADYAASGMSFAVLRAPFDVEAARAVRVIAPGETTPRSAAADVELAVRGLATPYLTRLRTRLAVSELDRDLTVRVSTGGDLVGPVLVSRALNEDPAPCIDRRDVGTRDAGSGPTSVICLCRTAAASSCPRSAYAAMLAIAACLARRRRGRWRQPATSLPGFMMPFGSRRALMPRSASSPSGPFSAPK